MDRSPASSSLALLARVILAIHLAWVDHHRPTGMPKRYLSSADIDAMVAQVAPAILALLGDGVPRAKKMIVAALADRHPKDEVVQTLMRLAVTDQIREIGGRYTRVTTEHAGGS